MTAQSIIECVELEMYINDQALTQSLGPGEQSSAENHGCFLVENGGME